MTIEDPRKASRAELPLKGWFQALSSTEQSIIEVDIFNRDDVVPQENVLSGITDPEEGRAIMNLFRIYLDEKVRGGSQDELKRLAKETVEVINRKFEEAES